MNSYIHSYSYIVKEIGRLIVIGFEVRFPELERLCKLLEDLSRDIKTLKNRVVPCRTWYSLKDACDLKGISYKTVCNKPYLQPSKGKPDAIITGRRMWKRETIFNWLELTDHEITSIPEKNI